MNQYQYDQVWAGDQGDFCLHTLKQF